MTSVESPWRRRVRWLLQATSTLLLVYGGLLALLWWKQEALLFVPQKLPAEHRFQMGSDVHESWVDVPGARLNLLHLQLPQAKGVVFFLHGNGGSLDNWFVNLDLYRRAGFDLVMLDYRGYGKSSGRIESEAQLHADVRAAWNAVAARYTGRPRVFFGRSLGTGLAVALAHEVQPDLTVLVSPYFSMQALAAEHYPWVPGALLRYPLRSDLLLPQLRGPVLLVHGERDSLIEPSHSQRLLALRPQSRYVVVPGAGHNDLQGFAAYADALAVSLAALAPP
ncbi:MAG: alpha/beta fold hydrolase [Rubrivivax sp.]|nr:alpha/beta fold hydrolase [Rubrivivax sp.]MDP3610633.1 alpha/beta fold hydrolase [Rubrivivax sp.]